MDQTRDARLDVATPGEAWDPMIATAQLLGRKWHAVVLHRLLDGPRGFNDLARSVEGLSNAVLSDCLDDLAAKGLVTRRVVSEKPFRVEYALTGAGETLEPVLSAMEAWGERARSPETADVRVP